MLLKYTFSILGLSISLLSFLGVLFFKESSIVKSYCLSCRSNNVRLFWRNFRVTISTKHLLISSTAFFLSRLLLIFIGPNHFLLNYLSYLAISLSIPFILYLIRKNQFCWVCILLHLIIFIDIFFEWIFIKEQTSLNPLFLSALVGVFLFIASFVLGRQKRKEDFTSKQKITEVIASKNIQLFKTNDDFLPGDIHLGNYSTSDNKILIITPFCEECAKVFKVVRSMTITSTQFNIIVRFPGDDPVSRYFILLNLCEPKLVINALDNWFSNKINTLKKLQSHFKIVNCIISEKEAKQVLNAQNKWCQEVKVDRLPDIYINGDKKTFKNLVDLYKTQYSQ